MTAISQRGSRARSIGTVLFVLLLVLPLTASAGERVVQDDPAQVVTIRWSGDGREDTAALIAAERTHGDTALVAVSDNFPDALAGSYLAGALDGPILLTNPDTLSGPTAASLRGFAKAILLGGPSAVSDAVASQIEGLGLTVERIGGADRDETAAAVAARGSAGASIGRLDGQTTAILARDDDFPDAMVAGALAAGADLPLLLTNPNSLPDVTRSALQQLGVQQVLIAGGTDAVSEDVAADLVGEGYAVRRVQGTSRTQTAALFARIAVEELGFSQESSALARGDSFPDALALAPFAGTVGVPILLTPNSSVLGDEAQEGLASSASCDGPLYLAGGPNALSAQVASAATAAASAGNCNQEPEGAGPRITDATAIPGPDGQPDRIRITYDTDVACRGATGDQFTYTSGGVTTTATRADCAGRSVEITLPSGTLQAGAVGRVSYNEGEVAGRRVVAESGDFARSPDSQRIVVPSASPPPGSGSGGSDGSGSDGSGGDGSGSGGDGSDGSGSDGSGGDGSGGDGSGSDGSGSDGSGGTPTQTPTPSTSPTPTTPPGTGTTCDGVCRGAQEFTNYRAPEGVGQDAAEPSIGVNLDSGAVMFQAFTETLRVTFDDSTAPSTATWEDVTFPTTGVTSLDPILYLDQDTGRTTVSQLVPPCSIAAVSDNDGDTWIPSQGCQTPGGFDHQTIGGGPYATPQGELALAYPNSSYYCSQEIAVATCARSDNGGITFGAGVPIYNLSQCGGLHGHLRVAPDGTVVVPNFGCTVAGEDLQAAVISEDDGLTWDIRQVPGAEGVSNRSDPSADFDSENRMYFAYEALGTATSVRAATSDDGGLTWTDSVDLGAPFGVRNAVFPTLIAGDAGRAAVAFLGAGEVGTDPSRPDEEYAYADYPGEWHLYVSLTYDGGQTWETVDVTPDDPVQRGCVFWGNGDCANAQRNLLDFIDISFDAMGRVVVGYADGCVNDCVAAPRPGMANFGNSQEDIGVIARLSGGPGLLAESDGPLLALQHAQAQAQAKGTPVAVPLSSAVMVGVLLLGWRRRRHL